MNNHTRVQWRQNSCAEHAVSQARLTLPPHESLAHETTEHGEGGEWALSQIVEWLSLYYLWLYVCTQHVSAFHTHISVSGVDSRSLWGTYPGVLSDTPTECVTQCAIVPPLKQNTRHHANHALSKTCMKPNVIPLTPQGHFVPQFYHRTARGLSSLKTSSFRVNPI